MNKSAETAEGKGLFALQTSTNLDQTNPTKPSTLSKSWSQVAGKNVQRKADTETNFKKPTKIRPEFECKQTGYDSIVVTPTHFNKREFKG